MKKLFTLLLFAFTVSSAMADTELSVIGRDIDPNIHCSYAESTKTITFAANEQWKGCQLHAYNSTSMEGNYLWIDFAEPTTVEYKITLGYNQPNNGDWCSNDINPEAGTRHVCFDISNNAIDGNAYINIQSATTESSTLRIAHIYVGKDKPIFQYLDEAMNAECWGSSEYNPGTKTITFNKEWGLCGWEFATEKDASDYNVLVCDITASCKGYVYFDYGNNKENSVSFGEGHSIVYLVLDDAKKNHIKRIFFKNENMASGEGVATTITLNDVNFSYESVTKPIPQTHYASFSAPYPVTIPEGVAVGCAKVDGNNIVVAYVEDRFTVIPANTGVILKGTGSCTLLPTTEKGEDWRFDAERGNQLVATSKYPQPDTSDDKYNYYGLLADEAAFAPITGTPTFTGNKAYIKTSTQAQQARLVIVDDDETTAVKGIETEATAMGKHLENGRLVIVKNGNKFNAAGQLVK